MKVKSREDCAQLDASDPLAAKRAEFKLPADVIYLDGNSLGTLTYAASRRVQDVLQAEWGVDLIKSWNIHGWIDQPATLGRRIAPLLGAPPEDVLVCDSTSVNLFKIAAAAARSRGARRKIVTERGNFPTDPYILDGLAGLLPDIEVVQVERDQLTQAIDHDTFLVVLTHVHYQTAEMFDLPAVTQLAHAAGAQILWDLSHSVGAVPVDLSTSRADFAIGFINRYGVGSIGLNYLRNCIP